MRINFFAFALVCAAGLGTAASLHKVQDNVRHVRVNASDVVGVLKNLQGTNNGDTSFNPLDTTEDIHDKDPALAALFPQYGIKQVLICGDASSNKNYNWTLADDYMNFVVSHGAKATINFSPVFGANISDTSPDTLSKIGYMITDRYMNGAHGSGFHNSIELFEFYQESDLFNLPPDQLELDYTLHFNLFAAFSRGVALASNLTGVGVWGGNRIYPTQHNYSVYDPYVSKFYHDCAQQKIPIKAATFHFVQTQFSFNPYDIKTTVDRFRSDILIPAGLPDLEVWATECEPNPIQIKPSLASAKEFLSDPVFFSSFTIGTTMYAQDTSIAQAMPWPGFGYGATGSAGTFFPGFFNKSSTGPVALPVARAWKLQGQLVSQTPYRVNVVRGHSEDGFAVLAGRSQNKAQVQVFLNNYQLDYDIPRSITSQLAPILNSSATAYPKIQDNGLLNGESTCIGKACLTFPMATIRNNTSQAYRLRVVDLPWTKKDKYSITIQRVESATTSEDLHYSGSGTILDLHVDFPANAQHLVTLKVI